MFIGNCLRHMYRRQTHLGTKMAQEKKETRSAQTNRNHRNTKGPQASISANPTQGLHALKHVGVSD